jgi:hypothetical protein
MKENTEAEQDVNKPVENLDKLNSQMKTMLMKQINSLDPFYNDDNLACFTIEELMILNRRLAKDANQ